MAKAVQIAVAKNSFQDQDYTSLIVLLDDGRLFATETTQAVNSTARLEWRELPLPWER